MKILTFLSSLLPSFNKSRLREDLSTTREELKNATLPAFKSDMSYGADKRKWASDEVKAFQQAFDQRVKTKHRGNAIKVTSEILTILDKNLPSIEKMVDEYYADDVTRDAMTFFGANLIQFLEMMSFMTRYSRRMLYWVITAEAAKFDADYVGDTHLSPGEVAWLLKNRDTFFHACNMMALEEREMQKAFSQIPDIVATKDNVEMVASNVGFARTDPFEMNFVASWVNPIYYVRLAIAEWQVSRYKAAQEERKAVELRLLQLKAIDEGKRPANLAQQLEYHSGRLKKLEADIAEMEDQYNA